MGDGESGEGAGEREEDSCKRVHTKGEEERKELEEVPLSVYFFSLLVYFSAPRFFSLLLSFFFLIP